VSGHCSAERRGSALPNTLARSDSDSRPGTGGTSFTELAGKSCQVSARAPPYDLARLARPHHRTAHPPRPPTPPAGKARAPFHRARTLRSSPMVLRAPFGSRGLTTGHGSATGLRQGTPSSSDSRPLALVRTSSDSAPPTQPGARASRARESSRPFFLDAPGPSTPRQPVGLSRPAPSSRVCPLPPRALRQQDPGLSLGPCPPRGGAAARRAPARLRPSLGRSGPADPPGGGCGRQRSLNGRASGPPERRPSTAARTLVLAAPRQALRLVAPGPSPGPFCGPAGSGGGASRVAVTLCSCVLDCFFWRHTDTHRGRVHHAC